MTPGKGIPFVDLITPHVELQDALLDAVKSILTTGMFVGGPIVEEFEREFAQYCDVKYSVGVNSGTDALRFALMAANVGRGDIVITVPNTFVATIEAILQAGATPHFVDIDPQTYNLSVDALRKYLETECQKTDKASLPLHRGTGKRVKAIMPVHLYGQICDMDGIMDVAGEYGLMVFEDACQAHGSEYFSSKDNRWHKAGSIGTAGAFSFYPGKNLGACGEAGAVTTNDKELAQKMRMIRDHGQSRKYHHVMDGYNGRLDAMQAAMLRVKLPFLQDWNTKRRNAAEIYKQLLSATDDITAPFEPDWSRGNYHLYVIRTRRRDELQQHLSEKKIGTGLHYPIPLHLQEGYTHLGYHAGDFPVTEKLAREILSLPMFPQLTREQQEETSAAILQFSSVQSVR
jgi:dTDP-4-amino-4,6-dideoxygalactose transaminase